MLANLLTRNVDTQRTNLVTAKHQSSEVNLFFLRRIIIPPSQTQNLFALG